MVVIKEKVFSITHLFFSKYQSETNWFWWIARYCRNMKKTCFFFFFLFFCLETHDHHHPRHYRDTIIYMNSQVSLQKWQCSTFSCCDIYSNKMMIAHNYYLWHFLKDMPRFFLCCQNADIYWVRAENMLETVKVITFYLKRCMTFYKGKYNFTTLCNILSLAFDPGLLT